MPMNMISLLKNFLTLKPIYLSKKLIQIKLENKFPSIYMKSDDINKDKNKISEAYITKK